VKRIGPKTHVEHHKMTMEEEVEPEVTEIDLFET